MHDNTHNVANAGLATSAIIVAGITAWTYVLAFLFGYGYMMHFGIPSDFIQIRNTDLIIAVLIVGITILSIFFYGYIGLYPIINGKPLTKTKLTIVTWIVAFIIISLATTIIEQQKAGHVFLLVITGIGLYRLLRTKGKTLEEKLKSMETRVFFLEKPFLFLEKNLNSKIVMLFSCAFITFCMAILAGKYWASKRDTFPVIELNNRVYVIVRLYDGIGIGLPRIEATDMLDRTVFIFEIKKLAESNGGVSIQKLGKLHVAK